MKTCIRFTFFLFFITSLSGQTDIINQLKLQNRLDEVVIDIHQMADNYIITGHTKAGIYGGYDIFYRTLDRNFNKTGEFYIGSEYDDQLLNSFYVNDLGSILSQRQTTIINNSPRWNIKIEGYTTEGKEIFSTQFSSFESDNIVACAGEKQSGYILVGNKQDWGDRDQNIWVISLDKKGRLKWQKNIGERFLDEMGRDIIKTAQGWLITGNMIEKEMVTPLIIQIDESGTIIWQQKPDFGKPVKVHRIFHSGQNTYIAFATSPNDLDQDILMIELDNLGRVISSRKIGYVLNDMPLLVEQQSDRFFVLANYGNSPKLIEAKITQNDDPAELVVKFPENIKIMDYISAGNKIVTAGNINTSDVENIFLADFYPDFTATVLHPTEQTKDAAAEKPLQVLTPATTVKQRVTNVKNTVSQENGPSLKGKYYALIIGVNDYQDEQINDLDNPIKDGEALLNALRKYYSFPEEQSYFLKNPTREDIITQLDQLINTITPDDNLIIFYAGHGYWDEKINIGYWLPADARKANTANWLRNSTIKDYIGAINSKHTLLIADACFSGGIFKTRKAFDDQSEAITKLYELPSRKAMTSGTLTEVPDVSVFIKYLVKRLEENQEKYISSEQLFSNIRTAVLNNSSNIPQYGEIRDTGDEGGDFIFIRKND